MGIRGWAGSVERLTRITFMGTFYFINYFYLSFKVLHSGEVTCSLFQLFTLCGVYLSLLGSVSLVCNGGILLLYIFVKKVQTLAHESIDTALVAPHWFSPPPPESHCRGAAAHNLRDSDGCSRMLQVTNIIELIFVGPDRCTNGITDWQLPLIII